MIGQLFFFFFLKEEKSVLIRRYVEKWRTDGQHSTSLVDAAFFFFCFFLNCRSRSSPPTSCDVHEVHLAAAGSQLPV